MKPGNVQSFDLEAAQKHPEQLHVLRAKAGINFQPYEQAWKEFKILHGRLRTVCIFRSVDVKCRERFDTFSFVLRLKQYENIFILIEKIISCIEMLLFLLIIVPKYILRIFSYFRIHVMYVEKIACKWFNVPIENKFNFMEITFVGKGL